MSGYNVAMPTLLPEPAMADGAPMARAPNRIEELRKTAGLTLDDLASRLAVDTSTIWKLEKGRRRLTSDWMERLARELGVAPADLVWSRDATQTSARLAPETLVPPQREAMPRDVPVFGTAEGGPDGSFMLQMGQAIDYVRRMPGLGSVRDAFALYVEGESMVPWRQPGELIFVNPHRPAKAGDYVVVVLHGRHEGERPTMVKRLAARRSDRLVLEQYNPETEIDVPLAQVAQLWRVMSLEELIGV